MKKTIRSSSTLFFSGLIMTISSLSHAQDATPINIAPVAKVSTSFVSGHETLSSINDEYEPRNSADHRHGAYGNWPQRGTQWVQYEWSKPISATGVAIYWWDDNQGVRLPAAARLSYWNGDAFVKIDKPVGIDRNAYNNISFDEITTDKIRLEIDSQDNTSTGVIEWRVFDSGKSPDFPPVANAGVDRTVVVGAQTYLIGSGKGISKPGDKPTGSWSKLAGPGDVTFSNPNDLNSTARFTAPGDYQIKFNYQLRTASSEDIVDVKVVEKPTVKKLDAVYASKYQINSAFWNERLKYQITNWIPHCIKMNEDPNMKEGGLDNLIEAGKKLRGEPYKKHDKYPFSNAWVLNTAEAMCVALTLDPQGDAEIIKTQEFFKTKLEEWIPIILGAQEPDGYFQTRYTLGHVRDPEGYVPKHWDPRLRGDHEGYVAGYFIEMGIAHYIATDGKDLRLYNAARKLADCWYNNIGPAPKQAWYDGHQEMEQALVRLGRFVNDTEGAGKGQKYIDLAKFLLDCRGYGTSQPAASNTCDFFTGRGAGAEYDQSHLPVTQQYTAVGHAVRAAYHYSAMADIAMETGDADYWSATLSIWDNLINRKYYVTGGIGSGETSEGFGGDYSLPSGSAYVESCSSCGLLFMQYKLNLATHNSKYADIYETTLYNALLGDVDLKAENFTYTNSLDQTHSDRYPARYKWHVCPCCVGNIPRALLMLPTWMYAKSDDAVFVNLFAGSKVSIGKIAGTDVELMQDTDYPISGKVAITVNPATEAKFTVNIRSPKREISTLYTATPSSDGIVSIKVNGEPVVAEQTDGGYIGINRNWKAGDKIELELPMNVQIITASDKIASTRGRAAIRRGPLIYNIESVDQNVELPLGKDPKLTAKWAPDLLGGVVKIEGQFDNGTPLTAIPNYARLNRGGRSLVWLKQ